MGLPGHDCRRLLPTNANADLGSLSWQPDQGDPFGPGRDTFRTSGVVSALVFGGPGRDRILTAGGSDQIHAGPGRDFVRAAGSEDTLDGGPGRDLLDGGTGRFDYIDYSSRRRGVRVDLAKDVGGARGERDRLSGLEHVVSGRGDDVILGDRRRSFLEEVQGFSHSGGPTSGFAPRETGNDIFAGRGGTDRVQSLSGDDRLIGGPGLDQLACQLDVRARCRLFGGDGTDELYGSAGPDLLRGGRGRDRMFAFGGNDRLLAKDAARDVVGGGKGFDYARVDLRVDRVHGVEGR